MPLTGRTSGARLARIFAPDFSPRTFHIVGYASEYGAPQKTSYNLINYSSNLIDQTCAPG
jgi:hypothetical protein